MLRRLIPLTLWLPLAALAAGIALPQLALHALCLLPLTSALLVFSVVIGVEAGRARPGEWVVAAILALTVGLLMPGLAAVAAGLAGLGQELTAVTILLAATSLSGGIAAYAGRLGLATRPALLACLATMVALPVTAPLAMHLFGPPATALDPLLLADRLIWLVFIPALAGGALRWLTPSACARFREEAKGLAILCLAGQGFARGAPLAAGIATDPTRMLDLALLALALALICGAIAALVLAPARQAGLGMLAGGVRAAPLVWAAAAPWLDPWGHAAMALSALPLYAVPLLVAWAQRLARARIWSVASTRLAGKSINRTAAEPIPCRQTGG